MNTNQTNGQSKSKKKGSTNQMLREKLAAANATISALEAQVAELSNKAKYITPECMDVIKLYRDTDIYQEKCLDMIRKRIKGLEVMCGEDIEDVVFRHYNADFAEAIEKIKKVLENDIIGKIVDEIDFE
ncbi:MAG: hypothetical protein IKN59_01780 [Paludibacteraceae bacterium]|nr:hypothetical protein [Paludibacteraceae bacterium]